MRWWNSIFIKFRLSKASKLFFAGCRRWEATVERYVKPMIRTRRQQIYVISQPSSEIVANTKTNNGSSRNMKIEDEQETIGEWMDAHQQFRYRADVGTCCMLYFLPSSSLVTPEKEQSHSPCHVKLMGDIFLLPNYRNHRKYTQIQFGKNQSRIDCITSFFPPTAFSLSH